MSDQKPVVIVNTQKKMGCFGVIGVLVVTFVVIGMCNIGSGGNSRPTSTTAKTTQAPQYTLDIRPEVQRQFEQTYLIHSAEFDKGENELQQTTARNNRKKAFQQLGIKNITDWVGVLKTLKTNNEGKAYVYIDLGNGLTICTWNNAFSDIGDNTLIPIDSPLFRTLENMVEGRKVKFSGTFLTGDGSDYFHASGALTIKMAMKAPNFVMKFSSISILGTIPLTSADVNLREGPSPETTKITTIPKGNEVKLLGNASEDGWIKIGFEDKEGYVNKQYLTF
jgi:uncharacterized protein YgiM (DUF1202 family)